MEWVVCAERLPELTNADAWTKTSDEVLVYRPIVDAPLHPGATGAIEMLRLESNRYGDGWSEIGWSDDMGGLIALGFISHWMPLPAAPVAQETADAH